MGSVGYGRSEADNWRSVVSGLYQYIRYIKELSCGAAGDIGRDDSNIEEAVTAAKRASPRVNGIGAVDAGNKLFGNKHRRGAKTGGLWVKMALRMLRVAVAQRLSVAVTTVCAQVRSML